MLFGDNVKRLRLRLAAKLGRRITQEEVSKRMAKSGRNSQVSSFEVARKHLVPEPKTIVRLAAALECEPWELLEGVETEYDRLRRRSDLPRQASVIPFASEDSPSGTGANDDESQIAHTRLLAELNDAHESVVSVTAEYERLAAEVRELTKQLADITARLDRHPLGAKVRKTEEGTANHGGSR